MKRLDANESYTVIAWVHNNGGLEKTDEFERFDGVNWRPKFRTIPEAHSVVWLRSCDNAALSAAKKYAGTIEADYVRVYQYESEDSPLERARREVMRDFGK